MTPPAITTADVEILAAAAGLTIAPEWREAVARSLTALLADAALLAGLALPEDLESAAVFRP